MIEINIDGIKYEFEELQLTYENAKILNKKIAQENLILMKNILDSADVEFILAYGTLLGAIREKDFINHDIDIDIIATNEAKVIKAIPNLREHGLNLVRLDEKTGTYSFMRNDVYIDIYVIREYSGFIGSFYIKLLGRPFPAKFLREYSKLNFLGEEFKIPKKYKKILEYWYGQNWMVPIANKPSNDQAEITRFLKKILPGKLFELVKKMIR